jgi:dipeptide/tripeptide permease
MTNNSAHNTNNLNEAKQLGAWAAIASLGYIFWIVGGMEIVERIAYYGVKASASLYARAPTSAGGLGITMTDFGIVLSVWAMLQTFVPVFSGGISDRIGYKETIAASTVIKITGYLIMGFNPTFWGFMLGAVFLATGTGIFKPGIQGTLAKATKRENSTMAWGVFYQLVNLGSFFAPLLAVHLRQLAWSHVFFACAAIISLNFLFLLTYQEPEKEKRLALKAKIKAGEVQQEHLWKAAWKELKKPIVFWYMLVFSGFWFMFNALFDVLPVHIADWVDTSTIVSDIFGSEGTRSGIAQFWLGLNNAGTKVMPEGIVNLNALMIMTTCFLFAAWTAKYRIVSSMLAGAIASVVAMLMIGYFQSAWILVFAITIFSIGEMIISPKKNEFMSNIAPEDKKAMYLGFVMLPQGIGWTAEGYWGPRLYDIFASKEVISRSMLTDDGVDITTIPQGEAFQKLVEVTGQNADTLTQQLYQANNIGMAWYIIGAIGSLSAFGIYFYGRWLFNMQKADSVA